MRLDQLPGLGHAPALLISGMSVDSRTVQKGDLFLAYKGSTFDGHDFIPAAIDRGAVAILAERWIATADGIPCIVTTNLAQRRGELASAFYGNPSESISCVGVTGTNGKTTVAYGLANILESAAFLGTLGWGIPPDLQKTRLTTVDTVEIQRRMATLRDEGVKSIAIEVSSHALAQHRVNGIRFVGAAFTNLTHDHLDYHRSTEEYGQQKMKLFGFESLKCAAVNVDDTFGRHLTEYCKARGLTVMTTGSATDSDIRWTNLTFSSNSISGSWNTPWGNSNFMLPMLGEFNVSNAAIILCIAASLYLDFPVAVERMRRIPSVPGRMEVLKGKNSPTVVIDYAHTPDGLKHALRTLRRHFDGKLICVFGCGGDRDHGKRPLMAEQASTYADESIVTSDNPRFENPTAIIDEVLQGFSASDIVHTVEDRARAIRSAIHAASKDDVVLIAGKGHEDYQEIAGERIAYSDRSTITELIGEVY